MIVLFPFISFRRSDQSLRFSIVDAGRTVGGVEAKIKNNFSFINRQKYKQEKKNVVRMIKTQKLRLVIGSAKSFFLSHSIVTKKIKLMP